MHEHSIKVRFSETDQLGHVNNNNYFVYMEESRIHFFEDLSLVGDGEWKFVVASVQCDFIRQLYFGQSITIKSFVTKIGNSSFHLQQNMYEKESGDLVAEGKSVVVQFDFTAQKSEQMPEWMKHRLASYELTTTEGG
ncbi:acyl-CoA thioesterase [Salimicrobium halophilum]|uniref:Acyl-CoA thioester hydrolase n=1 Tax=Salimicrobium halophilum TaxID=86666 RepID=A0A1G8U8I3_9BACI|nr:thioesterase family protein [Salimicrobium halophilum]SDJ50053.1 acyl-CoA thioester hydrolase [Salimicrobium halophilum]